jgi:hypothetical protein
MNVLLYIQEENCSNYLIVYKNTFFLNWMFKAKIPLFVTLYLQNYPDCLNFILYTKSQKEIYIYGCICTYLKISPNINMIFMF